MKKSDHCSGQSEKKSRACHDVSEIQTVQPFPTDSPLAENLGSPLPLLKAQIGNVPDRTYSYIVQSVKRNHETISFEQHGSAPNFQGNILTLCTCKHKMRASQSPENWQGLWIAGFTSRTIHEGRHWLFYLAKIEAAFESQVDLWKNLEAETRNAKSAHTHFLGDLFEPKTPLPTKTSRFSPSRYSTPPVHSHRRERGDKGWHNDIRYRHAEKYGHPPLLVADPQRTFLWDEPMIFFEGKHCRDFAKWSSLSDLTALLREAKS